MSAIFRDRKIPKRLIIREDYEWKQKQRMQLWHYLLLVPMIVVIGYLAYQIATRSGQL